MEMLFNNPLSLKQQMQIQRSQLVLKFTAHIAKEMCKSRMYYAMS